MSTSSLIKQTCDLDHAHSITNMQLSALLVVIHPLNKVRVVFSNPVHAVTARVGPPSPNHGPFTVKPSSHHVHVGLLGLGTYHPEFMVTSVGTALYNL